MPTPYKLKILNGVLKLKTFSDHVLSILGIKDLGTQTGDVTNGYVDWSIQHLTQTTAQWNADTTTILLVGQIGVENTGNTQFKFKIGNGTDLWSALDYAGGGGGSVDVNTIGAAINGAASATPNDTDLVMSVDTSVAKKNTWTQVKAFLKTYFDTIYQAAGSYLTSANITQTITNGVTDKAPSEDAVFDALALKQDYCVFTHNPSGVINPADGQYYYFGMPNITATNTVGATSTYLRELASPVTGVIEKAVLTIYCGNYATVNSDLSSWILKNTTNSNTNYTLSSSVNYSNANLIQQIDVTGLSIPITRGDLLMTLIGNATWATVNPTSVYWVAQYLVRKTS